ncbi:hypothetical protein OG21DRAFT_1526583 [Imleria badia]|nr:hypothetical protein OG21DRAFT_1526583 [Imleria badia]
MSQSAQLDDDLTCMVMIHALGLEYYHFTSSLVLLIKAVFQSEEINCRPPPDSSSRVSGNSVLSVTSSSGKCVPNMPCGFSEKKAHSDAFCIAGMKQHITCLRLIQQLTTRFPLHLRFQINLDHYGIGHGAS